MKKFKKKLTAVIFGISGQDGSYLADFLLKKNYRVIGVSRKINKKKIFRLKLLDIEKKIKLIKGNAVNFNFVKELIKNNRNIKEIYYLSGESSVIKSFSNPVESFKSNTLSIFNILENIKNEKNNIKVFYAASGQFFGNNKKFFYDEKSKILPQSPYGLSKATGFWLTKIFRESFSLYACSGILFNHDSPLRSKKFVTKKIVDTAKRIKNNKKGKLYLGNIDIFRDWGWAPEYVNAMWLMLQQKKPVDLIIGSGKMHSLREFVDEVFKILKLNKKYVIANTKKFYRKIDIKSYRANTLLAKKRIGWKAKTSFKQIIKKMVYDELY